MRFGSTTGHCIPAAPPPGHRGRLQASRLQGHSATHGCHYIQHPHRLSHAKQACLIPSAPPCRQTSSVLTAPAKWTSLMRPLHSSSRNDPTHPAQSILRRINIRISIIPDEHQGMPWEQHDLIKKRQNADHPGQVISNERTENKNEYLSMPYLDPRQVDKLMHLSSCNIPFVSDRPF